MDFTSITSFLSERPGVMEFDVNVLHPTVDLVCSAYSNNSVATLKHLPPEVIGLDSPSQTDFVGEIAWRLADSAMRSASTVEIPTTVGSLDVQSISSPSPDINKTAPTVPIRVTQALYARSILEAINMTDVKLNKTPLGSISDSD